MKPKQRRASHTTLHCVQPVELLPGRELPEVQPYVLSISTADRCDHHSCTWPVYLCSVTVFTMLQLSNVERYVCRKGAGTDANVTVTLIDTAGQKFGPHVLQAGKESFERGRTDVFELHPDRGMQLGPLEALHIEHDNAGCNPDWLLSKVVVKYAADVSDSVFVCDEWIAHPQLQRRLQRALFGVSMSEKKAYKVSVYTGGTASCLFCTARYKC